MNHNCNKYTLYKSSRLSYNIIDKSSLFLSLALSTTRLLISTLLFSSIYPPYTPLLAIVLPSMAAYLHGHPRVQTLSVSNPNRLYSLCCYSPPMTIKMSQDQSYWSSINSDIEAHLKQAIPIRPPLSVFEPMHHLTFSVPRNTAPALCIAACELVGGHRDEAMAAASALHLMHAATFAHENLPLTDRPSFRPTINHSLKPNIELLVPDGMVPFGFELLARSDDHANNNSDRVLKVIVEIARAMGSNGVVEGLYKEALVGQSDGEELSDVSIAGWMRHTCEKKEGEMNACAAACGAILGGASEAEIVKLRKFGLYVGMRQGYLNRIGSNEKELEKVVAELRNLALNELQHFNRHNVEAISSFINGV